MSCCADCPENVSQDPDVSPGPVEDREVLCRGAYDPNHGKFPNVKGSFIAQSHLLAGQLSVWRIGDRVEFDVAGVRLQIKDGPADGTPKTVFGVTAGEIRSVLFDKNSKRAFCIKDECEIDNAGGKHHAHAHIGLCACSFSADINTDDPHFQEALGLLRSLFMKHKRWTYGE